MSYDLTLFHIKVGKDAESSYWELVRQQEEEAENFTSSVQQHPSNSARLDMQRIADVLIVSWPAFVQFQPKNPLPRIELTDEKTGVQVIIGAKSGSLSMPYFRQNVKEMVECVRCCLGILSSAGQYLAYDPQLDRIVDREDIAGMEAMYRSMSTPPVQPGKEKKRWWKLW